MNMESIFLSYAGADRDIASQLKDGLILTGLEKPIWQDIDQIRAGDNWLLTLAESLRNCSAYLILVGPGGIHKWVKFELYEAVRRHFDSDEKFPIIPVLLPGAALDAMPSFLSIFQAERFPQQPGSSDYQKLAEALSRQIRKITEDSAQEQLPASTECPWPGLASYDEKRARFFFGRPTEILEAIRLLGDARDGIYRRWLQIEGPSGVGKSSLVLAGLIPAIESGWLGDSEAAEPKKWLIAKMRPGADPIDGLAVALAIALENWRNLSDELKRNLQEGSPEALKFVVREGCERMSPKRPLLLVVDQFEELFAPHVQQAQRERFDRLLAQALSDRGGPLHLVTTIRSDFTLSQQEQMVELSGLMNALAERYYLGPIGKQGLRDVVRSPARLAGLTWDEFTLPERIVRDAAQTPNPLPLVSNLLSLLWQKREGKRLLGKTYDELEGVGGALSTSAEALWKNLDDDGRSHARKLLLKLVSVGRDRPDTRRTISLATALHAAGGGEPARSVIDRLSGRAGDDVNQEAGPRLIVVRPRVEGAKPGGDEDLLVDLAHEALLTRWEVLKGWLEDPATRTQLEAEDDLEDAARGWEKEGKPGRSELPGPSRLGNYLRANAPSALAGEYLRALKREHHRRRRFRRSITALSVFLGAVGIPTLALGLWADHHGATLALGGRAVLVRLGLLTVPEPEMVEIPAGRFEMGSPDDDRYARDDEKPRHPVEIRNPFSMGKYEVTFDEYDAFVTVTLKDQYRCQDRHRVDAPADHQIDVSPDPGWGKSNRPVINASWEDAVCYASWLSFMTGKGYRLPTEAEWEYAARAGSQTAYWWGDDVGQGHANCAGCGSQWDNKQTAPVGSFPPNPFGLHDTAGNVGEWVEDCYHATYERSPANGAAREPRNSKDCDRRVVRGGSWVDRPQFLRSASRYNGWVVEASYLGLGFRLAQNP